MPPTKPLTVLITGCSAGGLGDALAQAFHRKGHRVIATARNPSKITHFKSLGIETLALDVLSESSIKECVAKTSALTGGTLDMLINNSGGGYSIPLADALIPKARELFDLNVWAVLEVTQAFLPLLLKAAEHSRATGGHMPIIVNNTSIAAVLHNAYAGIYNASKAAVAMLTNNLRIELEPFGIRVVDLRTGAVTTNFFANLADEPKLPDTSIYLPARGVVEESMAGKAIEKMMVPADKWAAQVCGDLLARKPKPRIWRGGSAFLAWFVTLVMPVWVMDFFLKGHGGLDVLEKKLAKGKGGSDRNTR